MSRIGKLPVVIPENVEVNIVGLSIEIKGNKGIINRDFFGPIEIERKDNTIIVKSLDPKNTAMWGTARSVISSMVKGVTEGFREELEVNGVGYRAVVKGSFFKFNIRKKS